MLVNESIDDLRAALPISSPLTVPSNVVTLFSSAFKLPSVAIPFVFWYNSFNAARTVVSFVTGSPSPSAAAVVTVIAESCFVSISETILLIASWMDFDSPSIVTLASAPTFFQPRAATFSSVASAGE